MPGGKSLALPQDARPRLPVYAYHLKPPFLLDKQGRRGLYPAMLALLQERLPAWHLELQYLPRRRLDAMLDQRQLDGLVMAVSPAWFAPEVREQCRWTVALLDDADVLVSRRDAPVRYAGPQSLYGLRVALPRGYLVPGVNEAIAAGLIAGTEPETELSALAMLLRGHVQVAVVTELTYRAWLMQNPEQGPRLSIDAPPLGRFDMGLLVPPLLLPLFDSLDEAVRRVRASPSWPALLRAELAPRLP